MEQSRTEFHIFPKNEAILIGKYTIVSYGEMHYEFHWFPKNNRI